MVSCGSKNGHQNDMSLKEIGLHAHKLLPMLGSILNRIRGHIRQSDVQENHHFENKSDIHMSSGYYEEKWLRA